MQFNCGECFKKYPRDREKAENHRKRLGCDGSINPNLVYKPTHEMTGYPKIIYNKCIGNFFDFNALEYIKFFTKYKENMLPFDCGYYDLPSKFVDIMNLVQNLISQKESEDQETLKRIKGR